MPDESKRIAEALATAGGELNSIAAHLEALQGEPVTPEDWLLVRADLGRRLSRFHRAAERVDRVLGTTGAQSRILQYLRLNIGRTVTKDELSGVGGISEWARRVRELRVEHGWPIQSGVTRDDLRVGEYLLEADEPNADLARDWRVAKDIRSMTVEGRRASGKTRLLEYLKAVYPRSADKEQLGYVAHPMQERPRRLRELAEEGWQIVSNLDDPDLAPGQYRLDSLQQLPARAREAIKLRYEILERDDYACVDCGRSPKHGDTARLQIHHLQFVQHGGDNNTSNLVTLCTECHAGRHSVTVGATRDELLQPESVT